MTYRRAIVKSLYSVGASRQQSVKYDLCFHRLYIEEFGYMENVSDCFRLRPVAHDLLKGFWL